MPIYDMKLNILFDLVVEIGGSRCVYIRTHVLILCAVRYNIQYTIHNSIKLITFKIL